MPPIVLGISIVRGSPVPVVDLGMLLRGKPAPKVDRFEVLRSGDRRIALAVESVLGIRSLSSTIQSVGALDSELLIALDAQQLAPSEVWKLI
jgi:purine-binding chemotaxis protein CheW